MTLRKSTRYAIVAFATALATVAAVPAHAEEELGGPFGLLCGLATTADRSGTVGQPGQQIGTLTAGPLVLPGAAAATTVQCAVQVGGTGSYLEADATGATTAMAGSVAYLPPTAVSYQASGGDDLYVCTTVLRHDQFGEHPLYFDGDTGRWSASPDVRCDTTTDIRLTAADVVEVSGWVCPAVEAQFPLGEITGVWVCTSSTSSSGGNSDAHTNARKKGPKDPVLAPVYPTGTIEISSVIPGSVNFAYSGFTPALPLWSCVETGTAVSCTPPAPATTEQNVCGVVVAKATNYSTGAVTGSAGCGSGPAAIVASFGPTSTASSQAAAPEDPFPWTCGASPGQTVPGPWLVHCEVHG